MSEGTVSESPVETKGASQLIKNTRGQVSADEVGKIADLILGIVLVCLFFFTKVIDANKGNYVMTAVGILWGHAFAIGAVGYAAKQ